ncbi:MAG: hypothetical protein ABI591_07635 [Kofleriaceae bacterium]
MKPGVLGGWVGVANAIVFGLVLVAGIACIPGGLIGIVLGELARRVAHQPVWVRIPVIAVPALAAALFLERRTRAPWTLPRATAR